MEQAYMQQGTSIDKGENARLSSFIGAIAIADLVKTTLGPKGMDKILQKISEHDQSVTVTNDGATILRSVHIDNAAAKVLVDIAKVQDEDVGDGTTSVAVLCGELLREAEQLINLRIHPQTIAQGWRLARTAALTALQASSFDHSSNADLFRQDLLKIARTTLSSKLLTHEKDYFAELCVEAVLRLHHAAQKDSNDDDNNNDTAAESKVEETSREQNKINLEHIQILKKTGGNLRDSYLESGFLLDKQVGVGQPTKITQAKILIANTSMDTDKIKIYGSKVKVDSLMKVSEIEEAEKDRMKAKVEKILKHDCNVFINRQLIYNLPESIFAKRGVMAIEHADFDGVERLAAVTGGHVVSTFDAPDLVTLGECEVVETVLIGQDSCIRFSGCKGGEACTLILRGASSHVLEEAERALHDALCVLVAVVKEAKCVYGGGCTEVLMAEAVEKEAQKTSGKKALAMEAFARALRQMPTIVADNGGYDAAELITQLRAKHVEEGGEGKECTWGLDMYEGKVGCMKELGVVESLRSKKRVVGSAAEAAEMILRVDDVIKCAPRRREEYM